MAAVKAEKESDEGLTTGRSVRDGMGANSNLPSLNSTETKMEGDRERMRDAMIRALRSDSEEDAGVETEREHIVLVDPFTGEKVNMNVLYEEKVAPWLGGCLPVIEDFLVFLFFAALFSGESSRW